MVGSLLCYALGELGVLGMEQESQARFWEGLGCPGKEFGFRSKSSRRVVKRGVARSSLCFRRV